MFKLDLTKFFKILGQSITMELSANVRRQNDLDGQAYKPVGQKVKSSKRKGKTIKSYSKQRRRLMVTGEFNQNAFKFIAAIKSLSIFVNSAMHAQGISYSDIVAYNDKNSPYLKGKHGTTIKVKGPAIFPGVGRIAQDDLSKMKAMQDFIPKLELEIKTQIENQLPDIAKQTIETTIG